MKGKVTQPCSWGLRAEAQATWFELAGKHPDLTLSITIVKENKESLVQGSTGYLGLLKFSC